jgi:hypothetical protein
MSKVTNGVEASRQTTPHRDAVSSVCLIIQASQSWRFLHWWDTQQVFASLPLENVLSTRCAETVRSWNMCAIRALRQDPSPPTGLRVSHNVVLNIIIAPVPSRQTPCLDRSVALQRASRTTRLMTCSRIILARYSKIVSRKGDK